MSDGSSLSAKTRAYRQAFDLSFAAPADSEARGLEDLLAIRVAGDGFVLRLAGLAGLLQDRKPVPLPTSAPGLLGLIGFRGSLCPVYDLAALLGYPAAPDARWLLMTREPDPIGLSFPTFEGHLRIDPSHLQARQGTAGTGHPFREILRGDGEARPVLDLSDLILAIRQRAHLHPSKED